MNTQRLKTLADFLLTVPEKQFDIEIWHRENECGTVACAAGWACTIPEFNAAGLRLMSEAAGLKHVLGSEDSEYSYPVFDPQDGTEIDSHEQALKEFFAISYDLVDAIFFSGGYLHNRAATPQAVANKIYSILEDAA